MNHFRLWVAAACFALVACGPSLAVLDMKSVPQGHYRVNLQMGAAEHVLNIRVQDDAAECVNSSDLRFKGMRGRFQLFANGIFTISFANENYRATQFWAFRPDGRAIVKEIPDRGETQSALPVQNESLARPGDRPKTL